jgi:hypothetical protein
MATAPTPIKSDMSWTAFAKAKETRTRQSRYLPFVLAMKEKEVYDATATFPKIGTSTLRAGIYGQARKTGRKVVCLTDTTNDHLLVALREAIVAGKAKT